MAKYWLIFKLGIQRELAFRGNFFVRFVSLLTSWSVLVYLWLAIYGEGKQLGDYSLKEMITYYTLITLFSFIITQSVAYQISDDIREGQLVQYLIKPLKYIGHQFFKELGRNTLNFLYILPIIIIFLVKNAYFVFGIDTPWKFFYFIGFMVLAHLLNFLIFYFLGVISFFSHTSHGLIYGWGLIEGFFSGKLVPLNLLPDWLQQVGNYLPFKFTVYMPIMFIMGKIDSRAFINALPAIFIWIIIGWLLSRFAWYLGSKKYEAYGQ